MCRRSSLPPETPMVPKPKLLTLSSQLPDVETAQARDLVVERRRDLIRSHVVRLEVQADQLAVELKAAKQGRTRDGTPPHHGSAEQGAQCTVLCIPWRKTPSKRCREIIVPRSPAPQDARPIRAETRAKLVASIARGRRWLDEFVTGAVTGIEQIAARENC